MRYQKMEAFDIINHLAQAIFLLVVSTKCSASSGDTSCPPGWLPFPERQSCLMFLVQQRSYFNHIAECRRFAVDDRKAVVYIYETNEDYLTLCNQIRKFNVDKQMISEFIADLQHHHSDDVDFFLASMDTKHVALCHMLRLDNDTLDFNTCDPHFMQVAPCTERHFFICEIVEDNICSVDKGGCPQVCVVTGKSKKKCACYQGYVRIGEECVDLDECSIDNGGCETLCMNVDRGWQCACHPGYRLVNETNCIWAEDNNNLSLAMRALVGVSSSHIEESNHRFAPTTSNNSVSSKVFLLVANCMLLVLIIVSIVGRRAKEKLLPDKKNQQRGSWFDQDELENIEQMHDDYREAHNDTPSGVGDKGGNESQTTEATHSGDRLNEKNNTNTKTSSLSSPSFSYYSTTTTDTYTSTDSS